MERQKALRRLWALGRFNAASFGLPDLEKAGMLEWETDGPGLHLFYRNPVGPDCLLAKIYLQPNGTWAALINAGVGNDRWEAMAKAEWAVARLTAEDVPERKAA